MDLKKQVPSVKVGTGGVAGGMAVIIVFIAEAIWPGQVNEVGAAVFVVAVTSIVAWAVPDPAPWNKNR